jgi:tetratricopeptide (TPR) repeat protein
MKFWTLGLCALGLTLAVCSCGWQPAGDSTPGAKVRERLEREVARDPKNVGALFQLGILRMQAGDVREAEHEFRRALAVSPAHTGARLKLATLLAGSADSGGLDEALRLSSALAAEQPADIETQLVLALTEWRLGHPKDAEDRLNSALISAPGDSRVMASIASMKLAEGDTPGAARILEQASESTDSVSLLLGAAEVAAASGSLERAEQILKRAQSLAPADDMIPHEHADLLLRAGRREESERILTALARSGNRKYAGARAEFLLATARYEDAATEFRRILESDPGNPRMRNGLVWALFKAGDLERAAEECSAVLAKNPKNLDALVERAAIEYQRGQDLPTIQDLNRALDLQPTFAEARYILAKVYQRSGYIGSSQQQLEEVLRLRPEHINARMDLFRRLVELEAYGGAVELMNRAPAVQKALPAAVVYGNWAALAHQDLQEFRGRLRQVESLDQPEFLLQKALLDYGDRHYEPALAGIATLLAARPEEARALDLLVRIYSAENRTSEALDWIERFAASHPASGVIQFHTANLLLKNGRASRAKPLLEASVATSKVAIPAQLALAKLALETGDIQEADTYIKKVLSTEPKNPAARTLLGQAEERRGYFEAARTIYQEVADSDPTNLVAVQGLARILLERLNLPQEAVRYAQRAKELAPFDPEAADTLGLVLLKQGMARAAFGYLKSAFESEPNAQHREHLAAAVTALGAAATPADLAAVKSEGPMKRVSAGAPDKPGPVLSAWIRDGLWPDSFVPMPPGDLSVNGRNSTETSTQVLTRLVALPGWNTSYTLGVVDPLDDYGQVGLFFFSLNARPRSDHVISEILTSDAEKFSPDLEAISSEAASVSGDLSYYVLAIAVGLSSMSLLGFFLLRRRSSQA